MKRKQRYETKARCHSLLGYASSRADVHEAHMRLHCFSGPMSQSILVPTRTRLQKDRSLTRIVGMLLSSLDTPQETTANNARCNLAWALSRLSHRSGVRSWRTATRTFDCRHVARLCHQRLQVWAHSRSGCVTFDHHLRPIRRLVCSFKETAFI